MPPKDSDASTILKKYVDELNAQSEQVEIQTGTTVNSSSSSTLAKYLSAAPKFKKSGVQMGSITSSAIIGTSSSSGGVDEKEKQNGSTTTTEESMIYQPKLNNHLNINLNNLNNLNSVNNSGSEKNNVITSMEKKRKIDDFLDEISTHKTPKKTKKGGFLKISNVNISCHEIYEEFSRFGNVSQCFGVGSGNIVFLEMKRYDAECAMHAMQKRRFGGQQIHIQWCTDTEIEKNCKYLI